jgi:type VI secretion system protein ImpA
MKKKTFDMDAILAPIPGDNPSGEDMRYSAIYEQIKEARRADDLLDQGDWQRDVKKSDWDAVIKVSSEALQKKTKDLQIAAWLTEALIKKVGFAGLSDGLAVIIAFINDYWDTLYPLPEEGDLEYRIGPLEFLNDKVSSAIKDIPITEPKTTSGYSWNQ